MGGGGEGGGVHIIWLIPYNDKSSDVCHSLTQQTAKVGVKIEGCFRVTIEIDDENQELFIGQNLMARNVQPEPTGSWVLATLCSRTLRPAYISCEGRKRYFGGLIWTN